MPLYELEEAGVELTQLDLEPLSFEEVLLRLLDGETLVIKEYEKTRGKDVLVRLDKRKYPNTQISYDVDPLGVRQPFWQMYNVSLNALSLHQVVPYDGIYANVHPLYANGSVVHYTDEENIVAIVERVYIDQNNEVFYTLYGELGYYAEAELVGYE